jgi:hypothetical protein
VQLQVKPDRSSAKMNDKIKKGRFAFKRQRLHVFDSGREKKCREGRQGVLAGESLIRSELSVIDERSSRMYAEQHDNSLSFTIINMENDNSQSPKDPKKKMLSVVAEPISSFFNNRQRSASPSSSKRSQGHSSKSLIGKLLRKFTTTSPSQSTLSLPLTSSTENIGGETPLGKYLISSLTHSIVTPS